MSSYASTSSMSAHTKNSAYQPGRHGWTGTRTALNVSKKEQLVLAGRTYEDRLRELGIVTLEERRHQMDMLQTYKILSGKEKVDPSSWFSMASDSERVTRQSADPFNIRPGTPRLDIRRYFYSQRVIGSWNSVPHDIKKSMSVNAFKNAYRRHRLCLHQPKRLFRLRLRYVRRQHWPTTSSERTHRDQ
jgi:hypothetical protein